MPANKYALLRYRIIDRCINNRSHPYPTKEDLRYACEEALYGSDGENISVSTIEKDIWAMRNESELGYYAPIAYHRDHRGYYYEEEGYSINEISLNDEDLEAIKFAANTLVQFRDLPIFQQFDQAIGKIADRLSVAPDLDTSGVDRFIQFESTPSVSSSHHLAVLLEAIKSHNPITLGYKKFSGSSVSAYSIHPYLLKEYRNRWYLLGWDTAKNSVRTFGCDRIDTIDILSDSTFSQVNFNAEEYFQHAIGITVIDDSPPALVKFRCTPLLGSYLKSGSLHNSQSIEEFDDHSIVSLKVLITFELLAWLRGNSEDITLLEPLHLREKLAMMLKSASDKY